MAPQRPDLESRHRAAGPLRARSATTIAWRVLAGVVLVVVTAGMWSDSVASWWSSESTEDSTLPAPIRFVLDLRPDLGEADIHLVVWAVTTTIVLVAVGSRWVRPVAAVAVGAWSVVVEALQPVVSETRGFSWGDVVGNLAGVALGAAIVLGRRRVRRNPRESGAPAESGAA